MSFYPESSIFRLMDQNFNNLFQHLSGTSNCVAVKSVSVYLYISSISIFIYIYIFRCQCDEECLENW